MILSSQGFKINEFKIPAFTLNKGEMIRFWVEIIPKSEADSDGYWGVRKMQEVIKSIDHRENKITICPPRVRRNFLEHIKQTTIGEYFKNRCNLSRNETLDILKQFGVEPEFVIRNLGTAHQKVLSIAYMFQKNQVISFDYYGLSPSTEEQLTAFVKQELGKGKSAIGFDNLCYKTEKLDSSKIINLDIRRERK